MGIRDFNDVSIGHTAIAGIAVAAGSISAETFATAASLSSNAKLNDIGMHAGAIAAEKMPPVSLVNASADASREAALSSLPKSTPPKGPGTSNAR